MAVQANATGSTPGIEGDTTITTANGVKGTSTTSRAAIWGTTSGGGAGVYGDTSSTGWGVYGDGGSSGTAGVEGTSSSNTFGYGVYGTNTNGGTGVRGEGGIGVAALCTAAYGAALVAYAAPGVTSYNAGYFTGDVTVTGTLTKGAGSFLIDHPLDPANKTLEHSFVESPERKNVYDGMGTADTNGVLVVDLPAYFEALNRDFRYQLTPIGSAAPHLHVRREFSQGSFIIAGAAPGQRISWQVTGNRKDAFALSTPLVVERDKPNDERGLYFHPDAFGEPPEKSVHTKRFPRRTATSLQLPPERVGAP
jgi:hypothetical protein